jgi:hypothetical protein
MEIKLEGGKEILHHPYVGVSAQNWQRFRFDVIIFACFVFKKPPKSLLGIRWENAKSVESDESVEGDREGAWKRFPPSKRDRCRFEMCSVR